MSVLSMFVGVNEFLLDQEHNISWGFEQKGVPSFKAPDKQPS